MCVADRSFLVANAQQGQCHIIYCSDGFSRLSGFSRAEVMQRAAVCDFLHGALTSQHAVTHVKEALAAGVEKHFEILYYKKDGEFLASCASHAQTRTPRRGQTLSHWTKRLRLRHAKYK
jgi:PAS domain-containing protein